MSYLWKVWGRWRAPLPSRWRTASTERPTSKYQLCEYSKECLRWTDVQKKKALARTHMCTPHTHAGEQHGVQMQVLHYYRSAQMFSAGWIAYNCGKKQNKKTNKKKNMPDHSFLEENWEHIAIQLSSFLFHILRSAVANLFFRAAFLRRC